MDNYKKIISDKYPSILLPSDIEVNGNLFPRQYEGLNFDDYLKIHFPNENYFISKKELDLFRSYVDKKYPGLSDSGYKHQYIINRIAPMSISKVKINNLRFYQYEIDFDRLAKLKVVENPVIVVKFEGELILFDGYHRTFELIYNQFDTINCFMI